MISIKLIISFQLKNILLQLFSFQHFYFWKKKKDRVGVFSNRCLRYLPHILGMQKKQ